MGLKPNYSQKSTTYFFPKALCSSGCFLSLMSLQSVPFRRREEVIQKEISLSRNLHNNQV